MMTLVMMLVMMLVMTVVAVSHAERDASVGDIGT